MGAAFVSDVQNFVLASPKHFALNNLENTRFELSAEVDTRTLHEVYLPHFKRCVTEARAASVMSAYNKVNGIHCGEHAELLSEILRDGWGFRGFVESDWFLGARSTAPSLVAGLDIEMPAGFRFADDKLEEALASGELTEDVIYRAARHSVYQKVAWQLTQDGVAGKSRPSAAVVECDEHRALAREAAEKSIVLLKNARGLLPLAARSGVRIAVVGDLADSINLGDRGSSMVTSSRVVTPLEAIRAAAGAAAVEYHATDADLSRLADFDVAVVVAGLTYRDEGEYIPTAQKQAEGGDLARGGDRVDLDLPPPQRELIERVTAAAKRTVVVLQGGSAIIGRDWIDHVDVRHTGARSGATVVQLYVSSRDSRVFRVEKELKGFGRVDLEATATVTLEIDVSDDDLRFYDAEARAWKLENCRYVFRVGLSSADLPLESAWRCEGDHSFVRE